MNNREIERHLMELLSDRATEIVWINKQPAEGIDDNFEEVYIEQGTHCGYLSILSRQFRCKWDKLRRVLVQCTCGSISVMKVFDLCVGIKMHCGCKKEFFARHGIKRVSTVNWKEEDVERYLETGKLKRTYTPYKGNFQERLKVKAKKELGEPKKELFRWNDCDCGRIYLGSADSMCDYCLLNLRRKTIALHNNDRLSKQVLDLRVFESGS